MHTIFKFILLLNLSLYGIGTQFLALPFSSSELSMGSHPTLLDHSPVNPALYQPLYKKPAISISHGSWFGDVTLTKIGYNFGKNNFLNHFEIKYSGIEDLELRNNIPSDEPMAKFSAFGVALDYGSSITRGNTRYGLSLSYIHYGLYTFESRGIGLNFGYALDLKNNTRLGASILNVGRMKTLYKDNPVLPRRILLGVSKEIIMRSLQNTIYGSIESNSMASALKVNLGNQFNYDRLNLYLGVSSSKEIIESSFGFGLNMNRFEAKYGVRLGSQNIGVPQILSIRFLML